MKTLAKLAEKDSESAYLLSKIYKKGIGKHCTKDLTKSCLWLEVASFKSHSKEYKTKLQRMKQKYNIKEEELDLLKSKNH